MEQQREQWNSRIGFILATVGSAVGLGNVWRFPTVVVQSGGGAFVVLFLAIVLLIGVPALIAELTLGRRSRKNVLATYVTLAPGSKWWFVGLLGLVAVFIILSFYSVIAGWAIIYFVGSVAGIFSGLEAQSLTQIFSQIAANPTLAMLGQFIFMFITIIIVITGITGGIERWSKVLMPGIIVILFVLLGRTLLLEGAAEGVLWFLKPDISLINLDVALSAVGQVFFSFSLGMGAILTYGSYLSPRENIPQSAFIIGFADVAIAVLMGLIVIPALFVFNVEPEVGPGIIFVTLPAIFNTMPASMLWSTLFFLMLSFAALTSAVSMLEVGVAYFIDERKWSRRRATILLGAVIFLLGVPSNLSQGIWSGMLIFGRDFLSLMDYTASNILLPLGGLFTMIFLAWIWGTNNALRELNQGAAFRWGGAWAFLVKYIIPVAILIIFINGIL